MSPLFGGVRFIAYLFFFLLFACLFVHGIGRTGGYWRSILRLLDGEGGFVIAMIAAIRESFEGEMIFVHWLVYLVLP
ncbi:hypothetical protein L873DRAFT_1810902 [Choiromyces venosus 120613-1]|uniref:Uncharacterized protein n=1 Tax=Choiromyces venosus 120613-1 TaxID=1336337 RepID=A0A3N4JSS7_9PEZI|nr:hypothetical protein L873DRAFT_1810902 [Choiromyces venosus 120613-1]